MKLKSCSGIKTTELMATMYGVRSDIVAFIFNVIFEALNSSCTVVSPQIASAKQSS
ncbi:hypothetical protein NW953_00975 [Staphylococcus aureus]|uniref:hypothetical protein n=1 Tax=Staphylococcus aureus TaxID=1280 RepID=UPI00215CD37A|nr:hypothetical protein [Staphylococcus aureus]UVJ32653.1 hypothetical protein NW953_00975 [Staphylococcus aureus]